VTRFASALRIVHSSKRPFFPKGRRELESNQEQEVFAIIYPKMIVAVSNIIFPMGQTWCFGASAKAINDHQEPEKESLLQQASEIAHPYFQIE